MIDQFDLTKYPEDQLRTMINEALVNGDYKKAAAGFIEYNNRGLGADLDLDLDNISYRTLEKTRMLKEAISLINKAENENIPIAVAAASFRCRRTLTLPEINEILHPETLKYFISRRKYSEYLEHLLKISTI